MTLLFYVVLYLWHRTLIIILLFDMETDEKQALKKGFIIVFNRLLEYKREVVFLSVLGILSALGNGTIPYITGMLIDAIQGTETVTVVGVTLALVWGLVILFGVVQLITYFVDWRIGLRKEELGIHAEVDYTNDAFSTLLRLPMSFHKEEMKGKTMSRIQRSGSRLGSILSNAVIQLTPQFLSILVALFVSFLIKVELAVILLVGVIIYTVILWKSVAPLSKLHQDVHEHWSKTWGMTHSAMENIQEIKQATTEKYEEDKLRDQYREKAIPVWLQMQSIWKNLSFYQQVTVLGTQVIIFTLSIMFIQDGAMTIGELVAFNGYAGMLFGPFVALGRQWQIVQNGLVEVYETQKILSKEKEKYEQTHKGVPKVLSGDVVFSDVTFGYNGDKHVLSHISLEAHAGESIALVGKSGGGKTTLIDLISGYYHPKEGRVMIDGYPVSSYNLNELRKQIATVPQEPVLFNDTIKYNLSYGSFDASFEKVKDAARKAHALEFIEDFPDGWEQKVGERGIKLSTGQKQRVAIARAILQDPRILILDEPTSALDAESEHFIKDALNELMEGRTTFIIAHRLSTVRDADQILVLDNGTIAEQGTHAELMEEEGVYQELYELQIGLHE